MGSTEEPDTMSIDLIGALPYTSFKLPLCPSTGIDWVKAYKPVKIFLNRIIPLIDPFRVDDMYDGVIGTLSRSQLPFLEYSSIDIEKGLDNLHSAGFITTMCQTANTYLHLMLIRHGSVFQIQNPWSNSIYGGVWLQSIPRDIIKGHTIGEAHSMGISHVGNLFLGGAGGKENQPQWCWDSTQNPICYGDPTLRVYVPEVEYSSNNNWIKPVPLDKGDTISVNGHQPFGSTIHPHSRNPKSLFEEILPFIIIIGVVLLLLFFVFNYAKRRKN
jgi:hypothetical protein